MRAEEVRIGNWTTNDAWGGEPCLIEAVDILSMVQWEATGKEAEYIKPIPLSEEWLVKFWFEKYEAFGVMIGFKHRNTHHLFRWITENYSGNKLETPFVMLDGISPRIHYVHQLQNLYFALISEELTITTEQK